VKKKGSCHHCIRYFSELLFHKGFEFLVGRSHNPTNIPAKFKHNDKEPTQKRGGFFFFRSHAPNFDGGNKKGTKKKGVWMVRKDPELCGRVLTVSAHVKDYLVLRDVVQGPS